MNIDKASIKDGRLYDVFIDKRDVTWRIRGEEVRDQVSLVSTYNGVRQALTEKQREIGSLGAIVMIGRDIGTVVLPNADYKFFLIASVRERAKRRFLELTESGKQANLKEIQTSLENRDRIDSSRKLAPLKPARDAIIIDTNDKAIDEVVEELCQYIKI
jgi:cytidylate kinase